MKLTKSIDLLSVFRNKTFVGVDIGTSSIKVVQLTKKGDKYRLDTYGEIHFFAKGSQDEYEEVSLKLLNDQVAIMLKKIIDETGVKSKKAAMSIPVFSSFSTIIEMPDLPKAELDKAVEFQARQYVPVPIDQVTLSSLVVARGGQGSLEKGKIQVLLIAVPNEVKNKYSNIAHLAGLDLVALEMETFPMARSITKNDKSPIIMVDIGAKSTNYCITDNGLVRVSHNYQISGSYITKAFLDFAGGDYKKADSMKKEVGINMTPGQMEMAQDLVGSIDGIVLEADRLMNEYFSQSGRKIEKVVLSGGYAQMPGLLNYFSEKLSMPVVIADPFSDIIYPKEIEPTLKNIGPAFSIAVGLAMRKPK